MTYKNLINWQILTNLLVLVPCSTQSNQCEQEDDSKSKQSWLPNKIVVLLTFDHQKSIPWTSYGQKLDLSELSQIVKINHLF